MSIDTRHDEIALVRSAEDHIHVREQWKMYSNGHVLKYVSLTMHN